MARKSIISESEFKDYVEQQLAAGEPSRKISAELKEMGFIVSHSAISNYHKNEMGGSTFAGAEPHESEELEASEFIEFDPDEDFRKLHAESVRRVIKVIAEKMRGHMGGLRKFPKEEIAALKVLASINIAGHCHD